MDHDETIEQAQSALAEYGYAPEDGAFTRYKGGRPVSQWVSVEGGFLRFERADGAWAPVPFTINEKWAKVSGLTADEHPECFDYVYPAEYILNVYGTALAERE